MEFHIVTLLVLVHERVLFTAICNKYIKIVIALVTILFNVTERPFPNIKLCAFFNLQGNPGNIFAIFQSLKLTTGNLSALPQNIQLGLRNLFAFFQTLNLSQGISFCLFSKPTSYPTEPFCLHP